MAKENKNEIEKEKVVEIQKNDKEEKKKKYITIVFIVLVMAFFGRFLYGFYVGFRYYDLRFENNNPVSENANEVINELNLSNPLNNINNYAYTNAVEMSSSNNYFSLKINDDKKSSTLTINWVNVCTQFNAKTCTGIDDFSIIGFDKKIKSVYIGTIGQGNIKETILFYLMNDGTLNYTKMFINKINENGETYDDINVFVDSTTGGHVDITGTISNASDVIKLYQANTSSTGVTVLGAKADGSFYDLGNIIGY